MVSMNCMSCTSRMSAQKIRPTKTCGTEARYFPSVFRFLCSPASQVIAPPPSWNRKCVCGSSIHDCLQKSRGRGRRLFICALAMACWR